MNNLIIKPTDETLEVNFDASKKTLFMKGESYPEISIDFFRPVMKWINDFFAINDEAEIILELEYLNSSSYKSVYDIFVLFDDLVKQDKILKIKWIYDGDDDDLLELGEELIEDTDVKMEFVKR